MVDWLEKFAQSQSKRNKALVKKASQIIVDKDDFPEAKNNDVVEYDCQQYKVINSDYLDEEGDGILLEKCAGFEEENPIDVEVGTSKAYEETSMKEQEYARVDPKTQDPDPRDEEVAKFEEEARQTEEDIKIENAIDGTSGATRPNRILERMFNAYQEMVPVEEETVETTDVVDDMKVDDASEVDNTSEDDDYIDLETYDFDEDVTPEENEETVEAGENCKNCDCNETETCDEMECDTKEIDKLKDEFSKCSNRIANRLSK